MKRKLKDVMYQVISLKVLLTYRYYKNFKRLPSFDKPTTFNEKIMNRMITGNYQALSNLADKVKVRDYVKQKIGSQYLVEIYGVFETLKVSDFDRLPKSFVIKTNHGTGKNHLEIVRDKGDLNLVDVCNKFNRALNDDWYLGTGELFYSKIQRKILIEEYLIDETGLQTPDDYKFHCFNGEILIQVDRGRFEDHRRNIYNEQWELQDTNFYGDSNFPDIPRPKMLQEMLNIARLLSKDFNYIRVDLYCVNNKIYFGEMTCTHKSGACKFIPESEDYAWGNKWTLDKRKV
ncbi:ATP-grasp fold amidoligase family protein [Vibrio breoganii]